MMQDPRDHSSDEVIYANGPRDQGEAIACDATDGCSTKMSGCHDAVEARTIRVKKTFFNETFPQGHSECPLP